MTEPVAAPDHEGRRRRLGEELAEECGIRLTDVELDELHHAVFAPTHERRRATYGALLCPDEAVPSEGSLFDLSQLAGDQRALFANGREGLRIRTEARDLLWVHSEADVGSERWAVGLSRSCRGTVVQRLGDGTVRMVRGEKIATSDGSGWLVRPIASRYLVPAAGWLDAVFVGPAGTKEHVAIARDLLSLACHVLSPAGVGATLIWAPHPSVLARLEAALEVGAFAHAFRSLPLSVQEASHAPLLRHALAQLDRAAIFDDDGVLRWLGVTLPTGGNAAVPGGTRHNSGAALSSAIHTCLVVIVSSDGPVTIFGAGQVLASAGGYNGYKMKLCACGTESGKEEIIDPLHSATQYPIRLAADEGCERCGGRGIDFLPVWRTNDDPMQ